MKIIVTIQKMYTVVQKKLSIKILHGLWEFTKTIILPIAMFFAGLYFADTIRKNEKKESQEELKKYFSTITDLQCSITKDQVIEYNKCAERIKKFETQDVIVTKIVGLPIDAYNSIDKKDLFFAFAVNDYKNLPMDFSNIITHFEYINNAHLVLTIKENKFINIITLLLAEFNLVHADINDIVSQLFEKVNSGSKTIESDKFLYELAIICENINNKTQEDSTFNISGTYNEFILVMNIFVNNTSDSRKFLLYKKLLLWDNCYKQIEAQYTSYYNFLTDTSKTLKKASTKIMSTLVLLNNPPLIDIRI